MAISPIMTSGELDMKVCDGLILYSGYLYMVSRIGDSVYHLCKVDATDYSSVSYADLADFTQGDAIVQGGGYLWVGDFVAGVYKVNTDLSRDSIVTTDEGVYAICTDGTYVYAGTDTGGYIYKIKISDSSKTKSGSRITEHNADYIHALIYDNGYLYGALNSESYTTKVFKIDASDLSIDDTEDCSGFIYHDDIVSDSNYFYLIKNTKGLHRYAKSDLSLTNLTFNPDNYTDGLAAVNDRLIVGEVSYNPSVTYQTVYVARQSSFVQHRVVTLNTVNSRQINEVLVDGDYVHILQITGTGSDGIYLSKWNKDDIVNDSLLKSDTNKLLTGQAANSLLFN